MPMEVGTGRGTHTLTQGYGRDLEREAQTGLCVETLVRYHTSLFQRSPLRGTGRGLCHIGHVTS